MDNRHNNVVDAAHRFGKARDDPEERYTGQSALPDPQYIPEDTTQQSAKGPATIIKLTPKKVAAAPDELLKTASGYIQINTFIGFNRELTDVVTNICAKFDDTGVEGLVDLVICAQQKDERFDAETILKAIYVGATVPTAKENVEKYLLRTIELRMN